MENSRTSADVGAEEAVVLCPGCGYDLRGTEGVRCSECGLEVDREALRESGVPWAHRGRIGRMRAYVRTVWWVTMGSRILAHEMARPQGVGDGRRFRWVTSAVVAATLVTMWVWVLIARRGLGGIGVGDGPLGGGKGIMPPGPSWVADLAVPWSAGATVVWVVPVCLAMLAVYMTGVQQAVFRVGKFPVAYRRRVGVMAHYAAGPLVWMLPALVVAAPGLTLVVPRLTYGTMLPGVVRGAGMVGPALAMAVGGGVLACVAVGGTLVRVGQWVARVRHGGLGVGVVAALELVGLWAVGVVLFLGVGPWCVGLVLVAVDSFR